MDSLDGAAGPRRGARSPRSAAAFGWLGLRSPSPRTAAPRLRARPKPRWQSVSKSAPRH